WLYVSQLFSDEFIDSLNNAYCNLIQYLAEHDWQTSLPTVTLPDSQMALITAANTTQQPTASHTLISLFHSQATVRENAPAIIDAKGTYCYQLLHQKSEALA